MLTETAVTNRSITDTDLSRARRAGTEGPVAPRACIIAGLYRVFGSGGVDAGAPLDEMTWVASNGAPHPGGHELTDLRPLFSLLATEPLTRDFWEDFVVHEAPGVGVTFAGNFERVSHIFSVTTRDPILVSRLSSAIADNLAWRDR